MKYRVILRFETTIDETESYNELLEDGCLPDEAEKQIKKTYRTRLYRTYYWARG